MGTESSHPLLDQFTMVQDALMKGLGDELAVFGLSDEIQSVHFTLVDYDGGLTKVEFADPASGSQTVVVYPYGGADESKMSIAQLDEHDWSCGRVPVLARIVTAFPNGFYAANDDDGNPMVSHLAIVNVTQDACVLTLDHHETVVGRDPATQEYQLIGSVVMNELYLGVLVERAQPYLLT